MPRAHRSAWRPILAVLLAGCGPGWRALPPLAPSELPPRQQVQVWSGGRSRQWHGVVVTRDSVSGIPFIRPLSCDSCRVAVPREQVDSLRVGSPAEGFWKSIGLVVGGTMILACIQGWCSPQD